MKDKPRALSGKFFGPTSFYRRPKFLGFLAGVFLIILCAALLFARSSARASLKDEQIALSHALTVIVTPLQAVTHYQVTQKYSGSIMAARESDHGFDTGGLLAAVLVDEGDHVKKGDPLARLDMRRLEGRARELEAAVAQAQAVSRETAALIDSAQATYDRYNLLVGKENISQQKYDDVKFNLRALKARKLANEAAITRAQAALKSLGIERGLATLTARFNGSVIRRYQDEGTAIAPGTPIIRLIEDNKLEIHVGLPQSAARALILGDLHIFDYQGQKVTARLRAILKNVDRATRTVTAIFDVTSDNADIRAGDLAKLSVTTDIQREGFWLPTSALAESRRGLWSVYSLKPYNNSTEYATLSRQELQVLYTTSDRVFVRGTVQNGDRIVTDGIHRLVPGQLVRTAKDN